MATSNLEKVRTLFESLASGKAENAARYIHPTKYTEHNPHAADGVQGFQEYVRQLPPDNQLKVIRLLEDGAYVLAQADGKISEQGTFFDVFRFEDGLIVEHWAFSSEAAPPNKSGHTQVDGPTRATHLEDTEENKTFIRRYYETFHIRGDHSNSQQYFTGDVCVRHEPGVRDGVAEFVHDVEILMQHRTIDEIKLLLGSGDLVFIAAKGTHQGDPCVYIDLYRVEDEKLVEHWGFPEMVPPQEKRKNTNDML